MIKRYSLSSLTKKYGTTSFATPNGPHILHHNRLAISRMASSAWYCQFIAMQYKNSITSKCFAIRFENSNMDAHTLDKYCWNCHTNRTNLRKRERLLITISNKANVWCEPIPLLVCCLGIIVLNMCNVFCNQVIVAIGGDFNKVINTFYHERRETKHNNWRIHRRLNKLILQINLRAKVQNFVVG